MTDKQKQIYRLGQIYGYICSKHPDWSSIAHDTQAARTPLQGVTVALFAAQHAEKIKPDAEYISLRMDCVDPYIGDTPCDMESQSAFMMGKMQFARSAEKLIDLTGLTQQAIADKLGVMRLTVGRWYRGETPIAEWARYQIEDWLLNK